MKRVCFPLAAIIALAGCATTANNQINLIPMYGGVQKSAALIEADNDFLKAVDAKGVPRDSSSRYYSSKGWYFYYQGNDAVAMKRFNQAWLLDTNNASAYFGFGSILGRRRSPIDSVIMLMKLAHHHDPSDLPIAASLAYSFGTKAYHLKLKNDTTWSLYKDTSLNIYASISPNLKLESDYGLQYLESLIMLSQKEMALKCISQIDTASLKSRLKAKYSFLVSEANKL